MWTNSTTELFAIQKGNIFAVPILHYKMELAACVHQAFRHIQPDCVAVELPQELESPCLRASSRLPDISLVVTDVEEENPLYYMCEPCDGAFEGLRSALEAGVAARCIDLGIPSYLLDNGQRLPDSYAVRKLGLAAYYRAYLDSTVYRQGSLSQQDQQRELFMARRLKELSLTHDRILFVAGMFHVERVLALVDSNHFPLLIPQQHSSCELITVTGSSLREVPAECGWIARNYELWRTSLENDPHTRAPDRHRLLYRLYKQAAVPYTEETGQPFAGYNIGNLMKFAHNYALMSKRLVVDLYQLITVAKGCVDDNYAYSVWELATEYPFFLNIDGLPEVDLTAEQLWGYSKNVHFRLKERSRKAFKKRQEQSKGFYRFRSPALFGICSHQPEDIRIENFGRFLKKRGKQLLMEAATRSIPFSSSLEEGVDTRETIRHWFQRKLYVKVKGRPPGEVSSVVIIFDEDDKEHYPWRGCWLGEHEQESDMAFYATPLAAQLVGPGISRCEYGGFLLSYPPRRLEDIWNDPDYEGCYNKAELLLMAAIDYASSSTVIYVAAIPPRTAIKTFATRFGKKIIYIPVGQLSPRTFYKLRIFHVLDGHDKRAIASEYIT